MKKTNNNMEQTKKHVKKTGGLNHMVFALFLQGKRWFHNKNIYLRNRRPFS